MVQRKLSAISIDKVAAYLINLTASLYFLQRAVFMDAEVGSLMEPLPIIPDGALCREFSWSRSKGDVTSIDVCSHGAYAFCGLSDGIILLFDLLGPSK